MIFNTCYTLTMGQEGPLHQSRRIRNERTLSAPVLRRLPLRSTPARPVRLGGGARRGGRGMLRPLRRGPGPVRRGRHPASRGVLLLRGLGLWDVVGAAGPRRGPIGPRARGLDDHGGIVGRVSHSYDVVFEDRDTR